MNRTTVRTFALSVSAIALLVLAGCHYSLLNRSSSLAAWSPDGSWLAVCIDNADADSGELWLVEPDSGTTRKLLSGQRASGLPHLLAPRWSPDGRRLYCARTSDGEKSERRPAAIIAIDPLTGETGDIGQIHYTGSRMDHFTDSEVFTPLADGSLAAQTLGTDDRYRLIRLDANGVVSPFTTRGGEWMVISGSPDGEKLAVALPGAGGRGTEIILFTAAGKPLHTGFTPYTGSDDPDMEPTLTWSPCSTRLALVAEASDDMATLQVINVAAGTLETVADDIFGLSPHFSPDGSKLAYAASSGIRDASDDMLLEVRVHSAAAGSETVLSLPGLALPLAWNPEGTTLAYYLGLPEDDSAGTVISVSVDGRGTRVVGRQQDDRLAAASPRGGRLAWVSGSGTIQVLEPSTGRLLFSCGLTTTGAIQLAEDHLLQGRPEAALETGTGLTQVSLDAEQTAHLSAITHAATHALQDDGAPTALLTETCQRLAQTDEPATALLTFCGALSDFGFRSEAEQLVEEELLANYPESPEAMEALWALAALKQSEGNTAASLRHLERLLQGYPAERLEATRALLLAALAEAGEEPAQVLELVELILEAGSGTAEEESALIRSVAHFARGLALEQQGEQEAARQAYTTALEVQLEPKLADGRAVNDLCWEALLRLTRN